MITLKRFLETNNVKTTNRQRAHVGQFVSKNYKKDKIYIEEDGFKVRLYDVEYLSSEETITLIIGKLKDIR